MRDSLSSSEISSLLSSLVSLESKLVGNCEVNWSNKYTASTGIDLWRMLKMVGTGTVPKGYVSYGIKNKWKELKVEANRIQTSCIIHLWWNQVLRWGSFYIAVPVSLSKSSVGLWLSTVALAKSALLQAADPRSVRYHTLKCSLWILIVSGTLLVLTICFSNLCYGQCTVFWFRTQSYNNLFRIFVNLFRAANLAITFRDILLVNANCIDP